MSQPSDYIVRCLVNDAIEAVAQKGATAPDREVLLACYGLMTKDILRALESLRWPLWFAGIMVGGSTMAQVGLKIFGG